MTSRFRAGLSALVLLVLAGCDWGVTDPVSISLDFQSLTALTTDGQCSIRYVARASGIGEAEWSRVEIRESGRLVEEFVGAETAQFWGQSTISAGDEQVSEPYLAPNGGANVQIDVFYRVTGPERSVPLRPTCASS